MRSHSLSEYFKSLFLLQMHSKGRPTQLRAACALFRLYLFIATTERLPASVAMLLHLLAVESVHVPLRANS